MSIVTRPRTEAEVKEITLEESLEWIEHMNYNDQFHDDCRQEDRDGYELWIAALRAALKAAA